MDLWGKSLSPSLFIVARDVSSLDSLKKPLQDLGAIELDQEDENTTNANVRRKETDRQAGSSIYSIKVKKNWMDLRRHDQFCIPNKFPLPFHSFFPSFRLRSGKKKKKKER